MTKSIASFAAQEVAVETLESVAGGWKDRDYDYDYNSNYTYAGNVVTNVKVSQYGNGNSATGAGAVNTTFA